MASVMSTLKSNYSIAFNGEQVYDFTFTFIPPLGSYYNNRVCQDLSLIYKRYKINAPAIKKINPINRIAISPSSLISNMAFLNSLGETKGRRPSSISKKANPINASVHPIWFFTDYSDVFDCFRYLKKSPSPSSTKISLPVPIDFL